MIQKLKISCVVDNQSQRSELQSEHGLSFWVEADDFHFLFDTGQGKALMPNIKTLGLDVGKLQAVVVSHGHYDHTGGLASILDVRPGLSVFAHPGFTKSRYGRAKISLPLKLGFGLSKSIGISSECKKACEQNARLISTPNPKDVCPGVSVTGSIPRNIVFENQDRRFFFDHGGREEDLIDDDQSLWMRTSKGIVVLLGCAHAGLINILDQVSKLSEEEKIYAIFGGLHLAKADTSYLERISEAIRRYDIQLIGPCHCTGDKAMSYLKERFPACYVDIGCGWSYSI